jgi:hypothetical protein
MTNSKGLSPENARRVQKLKDAWEDLRKGNRKYFSITRLTSIKSLCKDEAHRREYCGYLASLVKDNATKVPNKDRNIIELIQDTHSIIINLANESTSKNIAAAKETLSQLKGFQNYYKRVKSSTVRIINDKDILILEEILQSLLAETNIAASYAYDATRDYVEKYNPHQCTGLVVESIPMLEQIICFWKRYEVQ